MPGNPGARDPGWLHQRSQKLTRLLWDGLKSIRPVRVYGPGPTERRTPTVSFTADGMTSEDLARGLVKRAMFASHGDFYAATVIRVLGVEGLLRIGCAAYTTEEEIERLLDCLKTLCSGRGQ